MQSNQLQTKFNSLKDLLNRKLGQEQSLRDRKTQYELQVQDLLNKEDLYQKTSLFLQSLSDNSRLEVLGRISQIVTDAIQTVKDKNLEFKMDLTIERNVPNLKMGVLDKRNGQVFDILTSLGGGIADLVSVVLRIILLTRWEPKLSRVLIFDETGKHISVKDQENFSTFIKKLSETLNTQIIWISHSNVLQQVSHKTFEVTQDEEGISHVREQKETSI